MAKPNEYSAGITSDRFLFFEMRTIAQYKMQKYSNSEIVDISLRENLLQMPTEKSLKRITGVCLRRLDKCDSKITELIATASPDIAKQACLYVMMKTSKIIGEFMVGVIGNKYIARDFTFDKTEVNAFLSNILAQNENVSWNDRTIREIRNLIIHILVDTEYLDSKNSNILNAVYLNEELEEVIIRNEEEVFLPAFNRFI